MTDPSSDDSLYFEVETACVSIDESAWLNAQNIDILKTIFRDVIAHPDINTGSEFSVLLTNDTHIQRLNRDFRGKDKPTNVLSFPGDDGYLGDIAISFQTLEREAREQNKDFCLHFAHLLVHGLLHLRGYDHIDDSDAEIMEKLEVKILADMGIENPYI